MVIQAHEEELAFKFRLQRRLDQLVKTGMIPDRRLENTSGTPRDYRKLTMDALDELEKLKGEGSSEPAT